MAQDLWCLELATASPASCPSGCIEVLHEEGGGQGSQCPAPGPPSRVQGTKSFPKLLPSSHAQAHPLASVGPGPRPHTQACPLLCAQAACRAGRGQAEARRDLWVSGEEGAQELKATTGAVLPAGT